MKSIVCPNCQNGIITYNKHNDHSALVCLRCEYKLRCVYCGGYNNLQLDIDSDVRHIHCGICESIFWNDLQVIDAVSMLNLTYTLPPCPKCTSKKVVSISENNFQCTTCQTEFVFPPPSLRNNDGGKKSRLIIEPNAIQKLAFELLKTCPVCKSTEVIGDVEGLHCRQCNAKWFPSNDLGVNSINPIDRAKDRFWETQCPSCKNSRAVAELAEDGGLKCWICGHTWNVSSKLILSGVGSTKKYNKKLIKKKPKRSRASTENKLLCTYCRHGYIENGICLRCGSKLNVCLECGDKFADKTKTQGLCASCKERIFKKQTISDRCVICPRCNHQEPIDVSDIYAVCSHCEDSFAIDISSNLLDDTELTREDKEESAFQRFRERFQDLSTIAESVFEACAKVRSCSNADDISDNLGEIETAAELLAEVYQYINEGSPQDSGENDLWNDDDELKKWFDFDREYRQGRLALGDYNDVVVVDDGCDIL